MDTHLVLVSVCSVFWDRILDWMSEPSRIWQHVGGNDYWHIRGVCCLHFQGSLRIMFVCQTRYKQYLFRNRSGQLQDTVYCCPLSVGLVLNMMWCCVIGGWFTIWSIVVPSSSGTSCQSTAWLWWWTHYSNGNQKPLAERHVVTSNKAWVFSNTSARRSYLMS